MNASECEFISMCHGVNGLERDDRRVLVVVDGAWCAWSDWTECESDGLRQRQRSCECPPPVSGGLQCQGMPTHHC